MGLMDWLEDILFGTATQVSPDDNPTQVSTSTSTSTSTDN